MSGLVFHAPFLNVLDGFRLYGVWERSKNLAEAIYPGIKTYRSLEEILDDDQVELVIVNTPNATHFEYASRALLANKHVIVEKPFTTTVQEARELIELAKKQNRVLSVYQNRRYDSDFKTIRSVINENLLGELNEVEMAFYRHKTEISPKKHKEIPGPGAGVLYDLGSHLIDQALQLFGMPQCVFADIRDVRANSQVDDYFELLLYYDHLRVRLKANYLAREGPPGYILFGEKGSFIKAKTDIQETELKKGVIPGKSDWGMEPQSEWGLLHTDINGVEVRKYIPSERGNYGEYYHGIYQAIRENDIAPVTARSAMFVIYIIEAAFKSSEEKRVVDLNVDDVF